TAYNTPTRCTPFRTVYSKACLLPVEIKHKAYLALKQCNMDLTAAAKSRFMELNLLMELRDGACENTRIYKERTKKTAYKTPTRCTPFRMVYSKACLLPVEIKHKAYWAPKQCNMDLTAAAKSRFMELN
nr:hypothetical protein [Tanacetum cinerariifolium]